MGAHGLCINAGKGWKFIHSNKRPSFTRVLFPIKKQIIYNGGSSTTEFLPLVSHMS